MREVVKEGKTARKPSLFLYTTGIVLILILLSVLLPLLFFNRTVRGMLLRQCEVNVDFFVDQTAEAVSGAVDISRNIAYHTILDSMVRQFMSAEDAGRFIAAGRSELRNIIGSSELFLSKERKGVIRSVYIFREDGSDISYSAGGGVASRDEYMRRIVRELDDASSPDILFAAEQGQDGSLFYVLDYKNIDNLKYLGKIVIELDGAGILNLSGLERVYPGTEIVLRTQEGGVIFPEQKDPDWEVKKGFYNVTKPAGEGQMEIDVRVPEKSAFGGAMESIHIYLMFAVGVLALAISALFLLYHVLGKQFRSLVQVIGKMAESEYGVRMPESRYRELDQISEAFNQMADNLQASFQEAYQKGIALQQSESRLLTAQINPHFVFNVLESIHMRCINAGQKEISGLVTDLAQLLRGNIGINTAQEITIAQELQYVHYYMELQKSRFGELLKYSIEYEDEELLECRIPRLTIQPLVENAVVHGLEVRPEMGTVTLRIWGEEKQVFVLVADDGVGFDPLERESGSETPMHNHIAIENILRRLELLYGEEAGLTITSEKGKGTRALLALPLTLESTAGETL